jgi:hypothetical protein
MTLHFRIISAICAVVAFCFFNTMTVVAEPDSDTTTIPLNEPVRLGAGADAREIQPGTEEYYDLRVKGLGHVDNGRLVTSRILFAEILQVLEGNRLWVRELIPASTGAGESRYRGHARGEYWIVVVFSTKGMDIGTRRNFQVAELDVFYRFRTDKGATGRAGSARLVESPSLEQYMKLSKTSAEDVGLIVSLDPEPAVPAPDVPRAAWRTPREPAQVHVRQQAQDLTSMTDGDLAKRMTDFHHRRNFISRKLKQREEAVARVRESIDAVENEQEKKSRAGMLMKLEADVERVKFELDELNARYNELEQETKSR